jgi:hypothetical protein
MAQKILIAHIDRASILLEDSYEAKRTSGAVLNTFRGTLDDTDLTLSIDVGDEFVLADILEPAGTWALSFDGAASVVNVPDDAVIQNIWDGGGTAEFWIYADSDGEASVGRLADKVAWSVHLEGESGGSAKISFNQGFSTTGGKWTSATTVITLGQWVHVAVIYDSDSTANNPSVLVDGLSVSMTEITTPSGTRTTDAGSDLEIGNNAAGSATFDGDIDQVILWSDTRTSAEITSNLYKHFIAAEQGLVGYWRAEEGQGAIVSDSTNNGNDGTATSTTWATTSTRIFGGIITDLTYTPRGLGTEISFVASDWKIMLDKESATEIYFNTNDRTLIQDVFAIAGLSEINTVNKVSTAHSITRLDLRGISITDVLEAVTDITGFIWDLNQYKELIYQADLFTAGAASFSDQPDDVDTFPMIDPIRTRTLASYNAVEVVGAERTSADITDVYSGDGSTTVYKLGEQVGTEWLSRVALTDFDDVAIDTDRIQVQINNGTDGTPVWANLNVGLEGQDSLAIKDVIWNPAQVRLEFAAGSIPPNFANNAFRVRGRYYGPMRVEVKDPAAIASNGQRVFKFVLKEPNIVDRDAAIDVGQAFLNEQSNQDIVTFEFDVSGVEPATTVTIDSARMKITTPTLYFVVEVTAFVRGGTIFGYDGTFSRRPRVS